MEAFHGTTIVSVRRQTPQGWQVAIGGDGQVTLGHIVVKGTARKVRKLHHGKVLAGLAGATADAFTPFARFQTGAVSQNAFSESGAQSLNLGVAQQNTTSLRTVIGADFGANIPVGLERPLAITLRLGWAHEYADTARPMTAAFAGATNAEAPAK